MIKNRIIINENDRRNILSMYGLLVEEDVKEITFLGKVKNSKTSEPIFNATVGFKIRGDFFPLSKTNFDGDFDIKIKVGESENADPKNLILKNNQVYNFAVRESTISTLNSEGNPEYSQSILVKNENINMDFTVPILNEFDPVTVSINMATNIGFDVKGFDGKKLENYEVYISDPLTEKTISFINNNDNVIFTSGDKILGDLQKEGSIENIKGPEGNIFYVPIGIGANKNKNLRIKVSKNYCESAKDINIILGNSSFKSNTDKESNTYTLSDEPPEYFENKKNKLLFNINTPSFNFKVTDENKNPISGVEIEMYNGKFSTNNDGFVSVRIENPKTKFLDVSINKDGYFKQFKQEEIICGKKEIKIILKEKIEAQQDISGEPDPKNTLYTLYGKGLSKSSYTNAYENAKLSIIDNYINKHKRKYKDINIDDLKKESINLPVVQFYKRPAEKSKKENYVIVSASKKDVKSFLKNYAKKNNIKIESEPFEFENLNLSDALTEAFYNPTKKQVFALLGLTNNEDTVNIVNKIQNDTNVNKNITSNYIPIFIPVDRNNNNFNNLQQQLNNVGGDMGNTYPRIFYLTPKLNKEGKGEIKEYRSEKTLY